jgi:hypothetical protein
MVYATKLAEIQAKQVQHFRQTKPDIPATVE